MSSEQTNQQQIKYKCTLLKEVNQCPFYVVEGSLCTKTDDNELNTGMRNCAFKQPLHEKDSVKDPYVRKPRWYEEFYENKRKARKQGKQSDNGKEPFPFT